MANRWCARFSDLTPRTDAASQQEALETSAADDSPPAGTTSTVEVSLAVVTDWLRGVDPSQTSIVMSSNACRPSAPDESADAASVTESETWSEFERGLPADAALIPTKHGLVPRENYLAERRALWQAPKVLQEARVSPTNDDPKAESAESTTNEVSSSCKFAAHELSAARQIHSGKRKASSYLAASAHIKEEEVDDDPPQVNQHHRRMTLN
jgi:hypothetical protein